MLVARCGALSLWMKATHGGEQVSNGDRTYTWVTVVVFVFFLCFRTILGPQKYMTGNLVPPVLTLAFFVL